MIPCNIGCADGINAQRFLTGNRSLRLDESRNPGEHLDLDRFAGWRSPLR